MSADHDKPATKGDLNLVRKDLDQVEQKLTGKIDEVEQKLTGKIDQVEQKLTGKIDEVEQDLTGKIDEVEQKLTGKIDEVEQKLTAKLDANSAKLDANTAAIDANSAKIDANSAKISRLVRRVVKNGERLDATLTKEEFDKRLDKLVSSVDGMMVILIRLDQERVATTEWIRRVEGGVETNKREIKKIKTKLAMER